MTEDPHQQPAAAAAPQDPALLFAEELSEVQLRILWRSHILWVFGAALIGLVVFLLPTPAWYWGALRALVMLGVLVTAFTRVWQMNGIAAELRDRATRAAELSKI